MEEFTKSWADCRIRADMREIGLVAVAYLAGFAALAVCIWLAAEIVAGLVELLMLSV